MNSSNRNRSLLQELERADSALTKILEKVMIFNEILKPIELALRVSDFSSSGVYKRGTTNGIVCSLTALIKGDPLSRSLEALQGKGLELPSIIKGADRNESRSTCKAILKIIESNSGNGFPRFIVNLRWSMLPKILSQKKILIIGKRYSNLKDSESRKLADELVRQGLEVLDDSGEYGGGQLTYHLLESVDNKKKATIFEVTLSKELAEDEKRVGLILQALSIL